MPDQRPDVSELVENYALSITTRIYVSCGMWIAISKKEDGGFQSRQSNAGGKS
jgi:hypothetical protein